jgi:hypothetical protein
VSVLILNGERKRVNVRGHLIFPSGRTGTLARVGKKTHLNRVFVFPYKDIQ